MSRATVQSHAGGVRTISGRHVLIGLVTFFAIVLVADGYMIYKAVSTFGGLETKDAYRKGLAYNDRIAAAALQAERGWRDRLDYLPQTKRLRIALIDRDGTGVSGLKVIASLGRPATNRFDRQLTFIQTGPGIYEAAVPGIEAGWWTIGVQANRSNQHGSEPVLYEAKRRLWIKP